MSRRYIVGDFLRGTLGVLLQIVLTVAGIVLLGFSCVPGSEARSIAFIILGIVCFSAVAGVRYWLGTIHRHR